MIFFWQCATKCGNSNGWKYLCVARTVHLRHFPQSWLQRCCSLSALSGRLCLSQTPQTKTGSHILIWVTVALRHKCHPAVFFSRTIFGGLFLETMFLSRCTWWPDGDTSLPITSRSKRWLEGRHLFSICVLSCAICLTASHSVGSSFVSIPELWEWLQEADN